MIFLPIIISFNVDGQSFLSFSVKGLYAFSGEVVEFSLIL
jgi:hypothetical protein